MDIVKDFYDDMENIALNILVIFLLSLVTKHTAKSCEGFSRFPGNMSTIESHYYDNHVEDQTKGCMFEGPVPC